MKKNYSKLLLSSQEREATLYSNIVVTCQRYCNSLLVSVSKLNQMAKAIV